MPFDSRIYYDKHRKELSEKKKQKYQATKKVVQDRALKYYYKNRRSILQTRKLKSSLMRMSKPRTYIQVFGRPVGVFRIGDVSRAIGKRPVTIRKWEREGVIPVITGFRDDSNRRVYTKEMIQAIVDRYRQYNLGVGISFRSCGFSDDLKKDFTSILAALKNQTA